MRARVSHVLFDFFGTLVDYSASRTEQGYRGSHALLGAAGARLDYEQFLALWSAVSEELETRAAQSHREFSMAELGKAFLERVPGVEPDGDLVRELVARYVSEWNSGVRYLDGLDALLAELADRFTLAVITNTHDPTLVPAHLERMGVAHRFADVVTSVELGIRKPAPEIFAEALGRLGAAAGGCIYVGDSFEADYRGALAAGLAPRLIDPKRRHAIPDRERLDSIFDLARL